jgi:hypothetical protein
LNLIFLNYFVFIDQEWKKEVRGHNSNQLNEPSKNKTVILAIVGLLLIILIAGVIFLYFGRQIKPNNSNLSGSTTTPVMSTSTPKFPPDQYTNPDVTNSSSTTTIKAEDLTFGSFYKKPNDNFVPSIKNYTLPINIKKDVTNYFEVSRKINLDSYLANLNSQGFAIMDNPSNKDVSEFYSSYRFFIEKDLPIVLTTDFLYYYYQNTLKQIHKDIQKTIFYDNLWDVNKKMYDIAHTRYNQRLAKVGQTNDPILEAERLEAAYFAVSLNLLIPSQIQINKQTELADSNKFTEQEASNYYFDLPEYLKTDVLKEVELIKKGQDEIKSPVLLYQKDYKYYIVPAEYKENAKLNNFYLTLKWFNSVFPLYYRSTDCEDCILDKDDWLINMMAANLIAKDFSDNQEIKNEWATIYKFISFFSGLRQDLTYLQYIESINNIFGKDYEMENIFSPNNPNREDDLRKLQEKIISYNFSSIEGEIMRDLPNARKFIGMRLLQEDYWPNDYIFRQLVGEDMLVDKTKEIVYTSCPAKKDNKLIRCRGFGLDIVNLLKSENNALENKYFIKNTNYTNYNRQKDILEKELDGFNVNTWNNNVYWVTLNINKKLLSYDRSKLPIFMNNNKWFDLKDTNTSLGSWVNLHLPGDKLIPYSEKVGSSLGTISRDENSNYVEPNVEFIEELIAKNQMLMEMLKALITKKTSTAFVDLGSLDDKLSKILKIAKKELSNEKLTDDDYRIINDLIKSYTIANKQNKTFAFDVKGIKNIESIEGVKFVVLVFEKEGKKILAFGPIFNYQEK